MTCGTVEVIKIELVINQMLRIIVKQLDSFRPRPKKRIIVPASRTSSSHFDNSTDKVSNVQTLFNFSARFTIQRGSNNWGLTINKKDSRNLKLQNI